MSGAAFLAATATILVSTMAPASADPTRPYAATGSDTIQDVWNGLTNDFGAPISSVASWDAFVTGQTTATQANSFIKTKTGGRFFQRPAGSGNGTRSLSAVWDTTFTSHLWPTTGGVPLTNEDVDFARTSAGPSASGTDLKYVPFARDAVAIAFRPTTGLTTLNLTTSELTSIYNGVDAPSDQVTFSAQPATSTTTVSINGVLVQPKIPQGGSGTRGFFTSALGLPATVGALAPYISDPALPGGLPENDGSVLPNAGDLIPFSAAQWIAQQNGKVADTRAALAISSVNGLAPTTGATPNQPGALFGTKNPGTGDYTAVPGTGVGVFNRDTYSVIPTAFLAGSSKQQALVSILGSATGTGTPTAKTIIRSFGFGTLSYYNNQANWKDGPWTH